LALYGKKEPEFIKAKENLKKAKEAEGDLPLFYLMQLTLQVCTERFPEFKEAKSGLESLIKGMETSLPAERVTVIWNDVAGKFRQTEPVLKMSSDYQQYIECDQIRNQVVGMVMLYPGGNNIKNSLRRKDF
jgi:hypothetical protein